MSCRDKWPKTVLLFLIIVSALVISAGLGGAAEEAAPIALIKIVAISPADEVKDADGNSVVTSGLPNVGVGTWVYLSGSGVDAEGESVDIVSYTWRLVSPSGSAAKLSDAASKTPSFKPDKIGQYIVRLRVKDAAGAESPLASAIINAGTWVGVGTVGGTAPDMGKGQCGGCHPWTVGKWQETGHAEILTFQIDGGEDPAKSHYGEGCIRCHTVGYDKTKSADNEGWDDVASKLGWTFPEKMRPGNWDAIPLELKKLGNIQCENCHGPGSVHTTTYSVDAGVCRQCHDAPTHHIFPYEWDRSAHAEPVPGHASTGEGCVKCHTAEGFIEVSVRGEEPSIPLDPSGITCAVCHDSHDASIEHQVRIEGSVTLPNGTEVEGGLGAMCMTCHNSRRPDPEEQAKRSFRGPHGGPQADMLAGTGSIEYGGDFGVPSAHAEEVPDTCVTCHMAPTPGIDPETKKPLPGHFEVGEHTYKVSWDGGTPDNPADDVENVSVCQGCHEGLTTFNPTAEADYDGDGAVEGIQTEVQGLLDILGAKLPPVGDPEVSIPRDLTKTSLEQRRAAYNYSFVRNDGSLGIHNADYAIKLLQRTYKEITGSDIPGATLR